MSLFSTEDEAVKWYDNQTRVLTKDFVDSIPWGEIKNHKLNEKFFPVVMYMRDVERFTEIYYNELKLTPTGRDSHIRAFMDKWSQEEILHAELLNRFLEEAGFPTDAKWYEKAKAKIPLSYTVTSAITSLGSNLFGKDFSAVHMTWGAINELSTLNAYKRLWELAEHPVLEHILRGIAREEAVHSFFYWSLAKLKLEGSKYAQHITKYLLDHFWSPVGQGTKPEAESNYVIRTLFSGDDGQAIIDANVNNRVAQLPGLSQLTVVTERVKMIQTPAEAV